MSVRTTASVPSVRARGVVTLERALGESFLVAMVGPGTAMGIRPRRATQGVAARCSNAMDAGGRGEPRHNPSHHSHFNTDRCGAYLALFPRLGLRTVRYRGRAACRAPDLGADWAGLKPGRTPANSPSISGRAGKISSFLRHASKQKVATEAASEGRRDGPKDRPPDRTSGLDCLPGSSRPGEVAPERPQDRCSYCRHGHLGRDDGRGADGRWPCGRCHRQAWADARLYGGHDCPRPVRNRSASGYAGASDRNGSRRRCVAPLPPRCSQPARPHCGAWPAL